MTSTQTFLFPATDAQISFYAKLVNESADLQIEIDGTPEFATALRALAVKAIEEAPSKFNKAAMSAQIDRLKGINATMRQTAAAARKAARPAPAASTAITDGMYRKDGVIYKVQKAVHGSGNLYAKKLVISEVQGDKAGFEYAPGIVRKLTLADKMTLEEAKEFGQLYGICCQCGATLTDETSIAAGIGPICAGKTSYWA
jgi:hypothetical protein